MEQSLTNETIPNWYICVHCGEYIGKIKKMYCQYCTTVTQRKEIDKQNEEIFAKHGLQYSHKKT